MFEKERPVLFDRAPCGYHALDADGVIVSANATLLKWLGYERGDMIGKMRFTDLADDDADIVNEKIATLEKSKEGRTELILIRKNGDRLPVVMSLVDSADISNRLFAIMDNTRCYEARERIRYLDQELEAFSYSISHDLRAPLRSIDGYSKILHEDYAQHLDDEGRRVLNVVMSNAKRMGKLIDDLLEFGRLGRKPLLRAHVDMTSVVKTILEDLLPQESARQITVDIPDLLPAYADNEMIRLVWLNLIENAIKYTSKKDRTLIEVQSERIGDREICYKVKDNGVGFDMKYAGKLFGIFQRLHKIQDFSGTGVGLALVKRIVSRHGGRVWAEAALNEGAAFYFTLPTEIEDENR